MHHWRSADPDNIEIWQSEELSPVPHRRGRWIVFPAKIFRAFVCRVRDGDNFDFRMFLESWQMTSANNVARADNPNPQFVIIFLHWVVRYRSCKLDSLLCELNLTVMWSSSFNSGKFRE